MTETVTVNNKDELLSGFRPRIRPQNMLNVDLFLVAGLNLSAVGLSGGNP